MAQNGFQRVQPNTFLQTITYASGATSVTADIGGSKLIGVIYPSAMTSTTLALRCAFDGATYVPAYNNFGTAVSLNIVASTNGAAMFNPADVAGIEGMIMLVGATAGEAAARTLQLITRPL